MEKLSYLTTFVALIYGLGIANVLAHLSLLLKRGRDADWYWVHTLWTLYLILFMATLWWVQLNWGAVRHISYLDYLSLLLMPALVFVASDLLFPERRRDGNIALKVHFFARIDLQEYSSSRALIGAQKEMHSVLSPLARISVHSSGLNEWISGAGITVLQ